MASLGRGLEIITAVAEYGSVRVESMAEQLNIPVSTAYRYVRTLRESGFVDHRDGRCVPGIRLRRLASLGRDNDSLVAASRAFLRWLVDRTGETAILTSRVRFQALCLDRIESPLGIRLSFEEGALLPLYAGASGKVLLAFAPAKVREQVIADGLPRLGPSTPDEPILRLQLDNIRSARLAVTYEEVDPGAAAIAAPVFRHGRLVSALSVAGPMMRLEEDRIEAIGKAVMRAAGGLTRRLSGPKLEAVA